MPEPRVTVDRDGHILLIGFNRTDKRNAADWQLLSELSLAYGLLERDPDLWCGLVYAHGDHFTGGLDLADVARGSARTVSTSSPRAASIPGRCRASSSPSPL